MKLKLFQIRNRQDERVEIYYTKITPSLKNTINHLNKSLGQESIGANANNISASTVNNPFDKESMLLEGLSDKGELVFIKIKEIFYFEAVDKKVFAYMKNKVYEINLNLVEVDNKLRDKGFFRINKSNIINVYRIEKIVPEVNMRVRAVLENSEYLMINRSYKKGFITYLKERRNLL